MRIASVSTVDCVRLPTAHAYQLATVSPQHTVPGSARGPSLSASADPTEAVNSDCDSCIGGRPTDAGSVAPNSSSRSDRRIKIGASQGDLVSGDFTRVITVPQRLPATIPGFVASQVGWNRLRPRPQSQWPRRKSTDPHRAGNRFQSTPGMGRSVTGRARSRRPIVFAANS